MSIVLIILGCLVLLALIQAVCSAMDRRRFAPPGTVINGLHVVQQGAGSPPVVFESGLGGSSLGWVLVQPRVAESAATYSYDRAGFGWSDALAGGCSLEHIATNLHSLIESLNISRPFILVAHSFGGYVARIYTRRFPGELAGMVLVDPATVEEWMNPSPAQVHRLRRAEFFNRLAAVLAYFGLVRLGLWVILLRKDLSPGPLSRFSSTLRRIRAELAKFPPETIRLVRAHWSRPSFFWAMAAYLRAIPACAATASRCQIPRNIPVTVLSGVHQSSELLAHQAAMATRHVPAPVGAHFIHLDEPELVVEEIERLARGCPQDGSLRERQSSS